MYSPPKTGTRLERSFAVAESQTITFDGLPPIFSTPFMIWELEDTARQLMLPYLDPGQITVGTHVDVEHAGPALVGDTVTCTATVVQASGNELTFRVEAQRHGKMIGQGLHKRKVVSIESVRNRLAPSS